MAATSVPEVGAPLNKPVVNAQVGAAAQSFKRGLTDLVTIYEWSTAYSVDQLEALGFTTEEANLLKSGLGEVPPIESAVDATSFLKFFWGTGSST
jgi:hypothetical protein